MRDQLPGGSGTLETAAQPGSGRNDGYCSRDLPHAGQRFSGGRTSAARICHALAEVSLGESGHLVPYGPYGLTSHTFDSFDELRLCHTIAGYR